MSAALDSKEVIEFMSLFQKLRDWIDDDPEELEMLAQKDHSVGATCERLWWVSSVLSQNERREPQLFSAPVSPNFIKEWRTFEERYASRVAGAFLSQLVDDLEPLPGEGESKAESDWDVFDLDAKDQVADIGRAIDFACAQINEEGREFPGELRYFVEEGARVWKRLEGETGVDLVGILRRRELVPFVLIPRHVSLHHGNAERLSLLTHLRQAHDAFVCGVPFAALALMRAVLETTLKEHYRSDGKDLEERINNCRGLPSGASKPAFHRLRKLANQVLHFNKEQFKPPQDFEREIVLLLYVLRTLIEGVPVTRPR